MANCKDCVHYDICSATNQQRIVNFKLSKAVCKYFKDKSRFVELPCKVGDTAYWIDFYRNQIYPIKITGFEIDYNMDCDIHCFGKGYTPVFVKIRDSIGKNFFFTREEAEKALDWSEEE